MTSQNYSREKLASQNSVVMCDCGHSLLCHAGPLSAMICTEAGCKCIYFCFERTARD